MADRALEMLVELKKLHNDSAEAERNEALAAYNAHAINGVEFDPQQNGFRVTKAELEVIIDRDRMKSPAYVAKQLKTGRLKAA